MTAFVNCSQYEPLYIVAMACEDVHPALTLLEARAIIDHQKAQIRALDEANITLASQLAEAQARMASMHRRIQQLLRQLYGSTSERHHADRDAVNDLLKGTGENAATPAASPGDVAAPGTDPSAPVDPAADPASPTPPANDGSTPAGATGTNAARSLGSTRRARKPKHPRRKPGGRMQLPEWLAMRDEILDIPLSQRLGPDGTPLPFLYVIESWRLDYVPAHFERVRILRSVYGFPYSDMRRLYARPLACIVFKGLPTDRLVAQIVVDKFDYHLPLYRQDIRLERLGEEISRATLMNWIAQAARALEPIHQAIGASILQQPVLGLDDTYLAVLDPGAGKCHQGRLWGYLANEEFYCEYRATREGQWPAAFLAEYDGTVLGDAYSGHHNLFESGERTPAGCISHARRYFDGAVKLGEVIAKQALDHFTAIYDVEDQVAGCSPDEVLAARQTTSVGILDKLEILLNGWLATLRPSSATWIAANYTLKIYDQLREFTRDGRVPADNNALERCWRSVGIGRHNWLFAGSARGGTWVATHVSICQSCRLVGLDPFFYLQEVFAALNAGRTDYANLRPRALAEQHRALSDTG